MYYNEPAIEGTIGIQFPAGIGFFFTFVTTSGARTTLYSVRTRSEKGRMWNQPFVPDACWG